MKNSILTISFILLSVLAYSQTYTYNTKIKNVSYDKADGTIDSEEVSREKGTYRFVFGRNKQHNVNMITLYDNNEPMRTFLEVAHDSNTEVNGVICQIYRAC